jgi:hypothetical protein
MHTHVFFLLLGGFFVTASALGGPLQDTYWLQQRGVLSKFEVARDEVHF